MNSEQIIKILQANGISYAKEFKWAEGNGCISEYDETFAMAYACMQEYITYGMNNGFSDKTKEAINTLTKIIVEIGKEKDVKNRAKIVRKIEDVGATVRDEMDKNDNAKGQCNVLNPIMEYIDAYTLSLQVRIDEETDGDDLAVLQAARDKFSKLQTVLGTVVDVCSTEALEYAKKILECLKAWGEIVAHGVPGEKNNDLLDNAIRYAEEWAKKTKGVSKGRWGKSNLATDISSISYKRDDMAVIADGSKALEKLQSFQRNLRKRKEKLAAEFDATKDRDEAAKLATEAAGYEAEMRQTLIANQNGLIASTAAAAKMKELNAKREGCLKRKERYERNAEEKSRKLNLQYDSLAVLEDLSEDIERKKNNPKVIEYLVSQIDFTKVHNILSGCASPADIQHVVGVRTKLARFDDAEDAVYRNLTGELDKQEAEREKARLAAEEHEQRERIGMSEDEANAEMEKWAQMLNGTSPNPQPIVQPNDQNPNPLGNLGDILDEN